MSRNRDGQPDLLRYIKRLEERVGKLESNSRLGNSSINAGSFSINGAHFTVIVDSTEVLKIGNDVGGNGQPGWVLRYGNGDEAVSCYGDVEGQFVGIWNSGQVVLSTDGATGFGIARPHLPLFFTRPKEDQPSKTTTNSSFEKMAFCKYQLQHPVLYLLLSVRASDGSTAGEYQVTVNSTTVLDVVTISAGTFALLEYSTNMDNFSFGHFYDIEVWARRTSGTGTIGVDILSAWAQQS